MCRLDFLNWQTKSLRCRWRVLSRDMLPVWKNCLHIITHILYFASLPHVNGANIMPYWKETNSASLQFPRSVNSTASDTFVMHGAWRANECCAAFCMIGGTLIVMLVLASDMVFWITFDLTPRRSDSSPSAVLEHGVVIRCGSVPKPAG